MLINLLSLIVVLGILIFIHEGGHFLAARALGAAVPVFSFGFGRRLFGITRGGTDYRVSLIPLGGYVRINGMGPDESEVVGAAADETPLLPRWQRALISIAGPAANAVAAILFVAAAFVVGVQVPAWQDAPPEIAWVDPASPAAAAGMHAGDVVVSVDGAPIATWRDLEMATLGAANRALSVVFRRDGKEETVRLTPKSVTRYDLGYAGLAPPLPAEVPSVMPGSAAEKAGLRAGDRILAVDGEPVRHFYDVIRLVGGKAGHEVLLAIRRGAETLTVKATPRDVDGQGKLGIPAPNPTTLKRLGVFAALGEGYSESVRMTRETFAVIARMVSGRASLKQMSGPIDIARFSGEAARTGVVALVWLLGVISLQLAIFNVLPIPLLDGGHLALLGIEAVRRKDLSWKAKERILNVGFWLIICLVIVVLYNDVMKVLPAGVEKLIPWRK
jgi:regulator of sigma E protease